ncbi:MAG: hypothetical protein OXF02_01905 [Simkaniaceae bacterium]|nr:hypothetical protein [Simkaniaceae bacterium]
MEQNGGLQNSRFRTAYAYAMRRRGARGESLLRYLSEGGRERLLEGPTPAHDPFTSPLVVGPAYGQGSALHIEAIHYSWWFSLLAPFSTGDQLKFLSLFDADVREKMKRRLGLALPAPPLSPFVKGFMRRFIHDQLTASQEGLIPLEFLPDHPLNMLVTLTKPALQHVIDLLSLYDLRAEMRQMVGSRRLRMVGASLSSLQRAYFRGLRQKEPRFFARLKLEDWDGERGTLQRMLHRRGLSRLGKALFGCHFSLLWHIMHRLDTGRAEVLRRAFTDVRNERTRAILIDQVSDVVTFIRGDHE